MERKPQRASAYFAVLILVYRVITSYSYRCLAWNAKEACLRPTGLRIYAVGVEYLTLFFHKYSTELSVKKIVIIIIKNFFFRIAYGVQIHALKIHSESDTASAVHENRYGNPHLQAGRASRQHY